MSNEESFNLIRKEITKGSLQERLGYDVYDKVLNHTWESLPEASREKFIAFLKKEGEAVLVFSETKKVKSETDFA